MQCM
jgi:hypothetical protein